MTPLHIVAGLIALLAGAIALAAKKGGPLHRKAGLVFVVSMGAMAASGATLAALKPDALSVVAGLLTLYLVATAFLTVRDVGARAQTLGWTAVVLGFAVGIAGLALGLQTALSATGKLHGYPPAPYLIFATIALLGAVLDVRMLRGAVPEGRHRVARHLWRMCCAMFIATASFFIGQAKVFPEPMRDVTLLSLPVLAVLLLWAYWLTRVLRGRRGDA